MSRHQMCCRSTIGWVPVLHKACGVLTAAAAPAATVRWWSFGINWTGGGSAGGGGAATASAAALYNSRLAFTYILRLLNLHALLDCYIG
jgi:hypothetical protein